MKSVRRRNRSFSSMLVASMLFDEIDDLVVSDDWLRRSDSSIFASMPPPCSTYRGPRRTIPSG